MISNYYKYEHANVRENTIGKFFYRNKNLLDNISLIKFLKYSGDTDLSNADRLFAKYTEAEKSMYKSAISNVNQTIAELLSDKDFTDLPLNENTVLLIPKSNFISELVSIKGKNLFLEQGDHDFFFANKLLRLLNDPSYIRSEDIAYLSPENTLEIVEQNIQVWIWSRALQKVINVSPFVTSASTSKSDIGSFSFQLSPIEDLSKLFFVDDKDMLNFFALSGDKQVNLDFLYKKLQYNDVVFIRFEKLQVEESNKDSFDNGFEVNPSRLPYSVWDMIGLIDTVSQSSIFTNNDYIVSVAGRDLMKLLIEDGNYFLSLRYLNNGSGNIGFGFQQSDKWFKRNIADKDGAGGFISYQFPFERRSINDTLGFIVNQLSNLGVVDDPKLFAYYDSKDEENGKRTKQYSVSGESDEIIKVNEINGIWQIVKIFFDKNLANRRIVDHSIAYVDSTILEQFNKICQKPFVEFFGDTYGDEFDFIVRQPPFNKQMIQSFLYPKRSETFNSNLEGNYQVITLQEKDIEGYNNLTWDDTRYSWYQLYPHDQILGRYSEVLAGGFIPIVYFDELAQWYGNKRMVINDNYLSSNIIEGSGSTEDSDKYRESLLNDLKYVIDTTAYLPFTRKGTISIPKGDRRIKRGTFIRVAPTNEIFYVDAVNNSFSVSGGRVDRSTVLSVSRGMLEEYILGGVGYDDNGLEVYSDKDALTKFSYFKIIETKVVHRPVQITEEIEEKHEIVNNADENVFRVYIPERSRIAFVHNNPGNLTFANQKGAVKGELKGGKTYWAKFATPEDGFKAVVNQIRLDARPTKNLTLAQFIYKYAPPSDNGAAKTQKYLTDTAMELNVKTTTLISKIETFDLAKLIIKKESSSTVSGKKEGNVLNREKQYTTTKRKVTKTVNKLELICRFNKDQFDFFTKRYQFNKAFNSNG